MANFVGFMFYIIIIMLQGGMASMSSVSNPVSPNDNLLRYWEKHISNELPIPSWFLNKASPLNPMQLATFSDLADRNLLSTHLFAFCKLANLLCFPDFSLGYRQPAENQKYAGVGSNPFNGYAVKNDGLSKLANKGKKVNNNGVEPKNFFRERMLKEGVVMPLPDIKGKLPEMPFLPRIIAAKLPFSTSKIAKLRKIFHAAKKSNMTNILVDSLIECERAPSYGEIKRCILSGEDMIDFATSILGHNVVVRTMDNTNWSMENILIGSVKGVNGGELTKSVSCHQNLFPSLLYYCHSIPKVRVYEADILDPRSKKKINHGVAICHIDTSGWSSGHEAFAELGSGPGKIEVCHWIFANDMSWTSAD